MSRLIVAPVPPEDGMRPAMGRVWTVYEASYDEVQVVLRARLATHPAFGPLLRELPPDDERDAASRERLRAAMIDWRWEEYWQSTREQATGYANAEIPLASWVELVNLFRVDMVARVFDACPREELLEDVHAVNRWLDDAIAAFAQAFVSANEQVIANQQMAIRDLSTPVLQLRSGLLILPIVGALDRQRLDQMRALLLEAVRERRARAVVLDVTGVPEIDSVAANALIGSVTSARMMGADVIISGLSAEISQTLVTVGIDLSRVVSAGDLQAGIELAERTLLEPPDAVAETIPELFEGAVAEAADRVWLRYEDEAYTYAQARARIGGAAAELAERGARRGERVLVTARNDPETLFCWLGAMYLGAIFVPVNPRLSATERAGIAGQVDAVVDLEEPLRAGEGDPPDSVPGPDDPSVLIPTSGTTGRSKLVTQTHRAYAMAGEGFPWWMELTAEDRLMTSLPLFHINAPAYSVLGSVAARAGLVLLPRFSASTFIESARRHGATEFNSIGAMLEILMRRPERDDDADNPLRLVYTGPSPTRERQLEMEERWGLRIVCGYAMSESPYGTIWPHGERPYGTLGKPRQHPTLGHVNDARVVDGELQLRNPTVMLGYWGMPEETERVLLDGGWLRTGDLVRENPDGTYTYVGREKEVIRRRGENLAPAEVEEALASHPDVLEAAVVGVPSELTEEEVKAFVVTRDGADLAALRDHAAERLAPFKVPRYLEAVDELPYTPTGRVAKHELPRERTGTEVDFG